MSSLSWVPGIRCSLLLLLVGLWLLLPDLGSFVCLRLYVCFSFAKTFKQAFLLAAFSVPTVS